MLGTRCHMLAMYVVLESYLGMLCDYPAAYEGEPGFEFVKQVPTVWDETRVIDAMLHEYIIIARRKGTDWYIGSINNHEARSITIPLDFLSRGDFTASIYTDSTDAEKNQNLLTKENKIVNASGVLNLRLAGGGGTAIHIQKKNE